MPEQKPKFPYLKQLVIGTSSGVLVLALAIFGIRAIASQHATVSSDPTSTKSATPTPSPTAQVVSGGGNCSIAAAAQNSKLGTFTAQVINLANGNVLYDHGGTSPSITASSIKYLTAASAISSLGVNYRISTKVMYSSAQPDTVILVGGGDPTLTRLATGSSVYKGAARISDLANQVKTWAAAHNVSEIQHIVLDTSLFQGPAWDPSWPVLERTHGYQPMITALMVDGDRANPKRATSARGLDPVSTAGNYFKQYLGTIAASADFTQDSTPAGSTKIAEVKSAKLSTLISYMDTASDNTIAEFLARQVAIAKGMPGSLASIQGAYQSALSTLNLDWTGVTLKDGSGESKFDVVTPKLFNQLTAKVLVDTGALRTVVNGFPVAGKTGTLIGRFTGANMVARGHVFAKTGSIFRAYALVGYMNAQDGSKLAFAIFASGPQTSVATRKAIDTVTAGIYKCGSSLSNG